MITTNYSRVKDESFGTDSLNGNTTTSRIWLSPNSSGFDETIMSSPGSNIKMISTGLSGKFLIIS